MKLSEINIRDPYILPFQNKYYLYGTRGYNCWEQPDNLDTLGFDVYISADLKEWSGPIEIFRYTENFWGIQNFWAPEVHYYNNSFYLFASFLGKNGRRRIQLLKANKPDSTFKPFGSPLTPYDWDCLDGTLYVDDNNNPFLVFCHEWKQITDGTIEYVQLTKNLLNIDSKITKIFSASTLQFNNNANRKLVTDGPFVVKTNANELLLIWSTLDENDKYIEIISKSDNGKIYGNWTHGKNPLFDKDGGHGMIFKSFNDDLYFTFHKPNIKEKEHPILVKINENKLLDYFD